MGYSSMIAQGIALSKKEKAKKSTSSNDEMVSSLLDDLNDNPYARHYQQAEQMDSIATPILPLQDTPDKNLASSIKPLNHTEVNSPTEQSNRTVQPSVREHSRALTGSSVEQFDRTDMSSSNEQSKRAGMSTPVEHTRTVQPNRHEQFKKNKIAIIPTPNNEQEPLLNKISNEGISFRSTAQYTLASYLKKLGSHITSHAIICNETGLALGTSRRQLKNFQDWGMISIEKHYGARNIQGMRITVINIPDIPEKPYLIHKKAYSTQEANTEETNIHEQFNRAHVDSPTEQTRTHMDSSNEQFNFPLLDRKKESISLSKNQEESPLLLLSQEDVAFNWPSLAMIDFGENQIRQIFERLAKIGKDSLACTDSVRQGLTHADAALTMGDGKLMDQKGNIVTDPRAYIFRSLARDGYYAAPKGYISPEAQRLRDEAEQARILSEAQKELAQQQTSVQAQSEETGFNQWRMGLSEQELEQIQSQAPHHAKKGTPFEKWIQLVYYPKQS